MTLRGNIILLSLSILTVTVHGQSPAEPADDPDYYNDPDPDGLDYEDLFADEEGKYFDLSFDAFIPPDGYRDEMSRRAIQADIVDYAMKFLGRRYVHGGKGPNVFDCSGYTSFIFDYFGIQLSPASRIQGDQGFSIPIEMAEVGDLIFFAPRRGGQTVGHVGMITSVDRATGAVKFIHASVKKGITVQEFPDNGYYSKRYLFVKRVI